MQKLEYEPFHTEPVQDYIRDNREYINNKDSSFSYEIRPRKQIDNVSILNKYQEEIAKLKAKNTTLKNQNKILLEELQKTNKTFILLQRLFTEEIAFDCCLMIIFFLPTQHIRCGRIESAISLKAMVAPWKSST